MRKFFNKIICFTAAAVAVAGVFTVSACSNVYKSQPLKYTPSDNEAVSNGGFAVEKDDYVYFINGKEDNTADNTYGNAVKGAIMRIGKTDLAARNYSKVDTVVPQIAYSGNTNAGIFVYGDYVYYATPSTDKNSDGEIQNSYLAFKRSKLDGTEAMKGYYLQYSNNTVEYRYVEENSVVYLLYVATGEKLFGEERGVKNIHSLNTKTEENTLLAYNVDDVYFDESDLTNSRVYYTMKVTDFELNKTYSNYNQLYTVTAGAERKYDTGANDYSEYFKDVYKDDGDGYKPSEDPKYVNCGTLVYDGLGVTGTDSLGVTPFNGVTKEQAKTIKRSAYTYTVSSYENGNLFYFRKDSADNTSLFDVKESELLTDGRNPVFSNADTSESILDNVSSVNYVYIFDENDDIQTILIPDSNGYIKTGVGDDGKIVTEVNGQDDSGTSYYITNDGQPTLLFIQDNYIYYSVSKNANGYSNSGYSINRVDFTGGCSDYYNPFGDISNDYVSVCLLDVDAVSDWYKPEMFENQLLFATQTENMSEYSYIMACDLNGENKKILSNVQIKELNEKYGEVSDKISEIDPNVYENLQNALKYGFYANESSYIDELIAAYVDIKDYDEQHFWSKESVTMFKNYVAAEGNWAEYAEDYVTVNGKKVEANKHDYYYALLGKMNADDAKAYADLLKTNYLQPYPETELSWFESLSAGEKAGFIIGVVAGGLIVIAAAAIAVRIILKKRSEKLPTYRKKRIKVDTTDDKNIDVYSDEQ